MARDSKCAHGNAAISCTYVDCLRANNKTILSDARLGSASGIIKKTPCSRHGFAMDQCNNDGHQGCNDVPCQQGYMHMLLKALESRIEAEAPTCSLDCVLKPGLQLIVANDLEVSRTSSITLFELLRRHQPDAAGRTSSG
jgi:hypothetical protein